MKFNTLTNLPFWQTTKILPTKLNTCTVATKYLWHNTVEPVSNGPVQAKISWLLIDRHGGSFRGGLVYRLNPRIFRQLL